MTKKTLIALISSLALLSTSAVGFAAESDTKKVAQTGTGTAAGTTQAQDEAQGGVAAGNIIGAGVVAATVGLGVGIALGAGGNGSSSTSTSTATSTSGP